MKTNLLCSISTALSILLLVAVGNSADRKKVDENKNAIRVVSQAHQDGRRGHSYVQQSLQQEKEQAKGKFDQRRFEQEAKRLEKISKEHAVMERIQQSLQKAERKHSKQTAMKAQQTEKVKLFGKPTRFTQAPSGMKPVTVNRITHLMVSNVQINGKQQDTIYVGDPITLTFSFAPNSLSAVMNVYIDADGNGVLSAGDIPIETNVLMLDNDDNDADPAVGTYKVTSEEGDGLNNIVTSLIFEINDYQSVSSAVVTILQKPTSSIVLGTVDPPRPYIACLILDNTSIDYPNYMAVLTDSVGMFSFYIDRLQTSEVTLVPYDITGATNGYIPPQYKIISITSDTTNVNFVYTPATSFIEGYVKDHTGSAISNAIVEAYHSFDVITKTDSTGYYKLGVQQGTWDFNLSIPWTADYLGTISMSSSIYVPGNTTVRHDFTFIKSNNTISGKITFNTNGVGGIPIDVSTDSLSNSVLSSTDGNYSVPVYQPSVGTKLYTVGATVGNGYFMDTTSRNGILPGATNVNFAIRKVTGGLQGTITDINTGKPIPNAYIYASGSSSKSVYSNDSGYYRMSLLDGIYSFYVEADLYYTDTEYVMILGAMVTKNVALRRSGSFSGTIKDADGKPLQSVDVVALDSSGYSTAYGYSDAQGHYFVSGLGTSRYRAYSSKNGYISQWYNNVNILDSATFFQVTDGFDTPNINFTLSHGGSISGKVVDRAGIPIAGVEIDVLDTLFNYQSYATTNDSGNYIASGLLTGKYYVRSYSSLYFDQWYNGADASSSATPVKVVLNQNTPNINFTLSLGASISGTVKNKSSVGISDAYVYLTDSTQNYIAEGYSDYSGNYTIGRLAPAKTYYAYANASGYSNCWYNNVSTFDSATSIVLQPEEKREHIDFILPIAGSISGRIFDVGGNPISNAYVYSYNSSGSNNGYGSSDQQGNYTIRNLSNGKYYVEAFSYGYIDQWFDHKPSIDQADKVTVIEEKVTTGINFDLLRASGISGIVVDDSSNAGLSNVIIEAHQKSSGDYTNGYTNIDGSYFVPLLAGSYIIRATVSYGINYLPQYYTSSGGAPLQSSAQEIAIVDGQPPKVINFRLKKIRPFYAFAQEKLGMTITNSGQFGSGIDSTLPSGRWPLASSRNYLYHGSFWIGGSQDNALIVSGERYGNMDRAWSPFWNYTVHSESDLQTVQTFFGDMNSSLGNGSLVVQQDAFAWRNTDYAIYEYTILYQSNPGYYQPTIQNAYIGFFFDFDISENGATDNVGIDKSNNLVYMYDNTAPDSVNMGVRLLSSSAARLTWWNIKNDPIGDTLCYHKMIKNTSIVTPNVADDYRVFVSAGPYIFNPGDSIPVAIAVVAGNGSAGIIAASKEAQAAYKTNDVQNETVVTVPMEFALHQNYPNPFNPSTIIAFDLPHSTLVSLRVYNVLGQVVATLVDEVRPAGRYQERWNASNLASGIYFYRLTTDSFVGTKKVVLMK